MAVYKRAYFSSPKRYNLIFENQLQILSYSCQPRLFLPRKWRLHVHHPHAPLGTCSLNILLLLAAPSRVRWWMCGYPSLTHGRCHREIVTIIPLPYPTTERGTCVIRQSWGVPVSLVLCLTSVWSNACTLVLWCENKTLTALESVKILDLFSEL